MEQTEGREQWEGYTMIRTEKLKSECLAAAGVVVSCTDPRTNQHYILLGVNHGNQLCNFHGWNDECREKRPSAKTTPYNQAAIDTASREFAEESLEVVGCKELMQQVLSTQNEGYFAQVMPEDSWNVRCFWVHMGHLGVWNRYDIVRRFSLLKQNPNLHPCQQEVKTLAWVNMRDVHLSAVSKDCGRRLKLPIETYQGGNKEDKKKKLYMREWLSGWWKDIINSSDNKGGAKLFQEVCSGQRDTIPLKPYLLL